MADRSTLTSRSVRRKLLMLLLIPFLPAFAIIVATTLVTAIPVGAH